MDDDAKTVADYKINEGGFIVMMVAKVGQSSSLSSDSLHFSLSIAVFIYTLMAATSLSLRSIYKALFFPLPALFFHSVMPIKASNFERESESPYVKS